MTRPTKEQVDDAIQQCVNLRECNPGFEDWSDNERDLFVLAAEVRALREERDALAEQLVDERRAHSDVRLLLSKWQCKVAYPEFTKCGGCPQCVGVTPGRVLEYQSTIERVEALKPAWLSRSRALRIQRSEKARGCSEALQACVDDLDDALRGAQA